MSVYQAFSRSGRGESGAGHAKGLCLRPAPMMHDAVKKILI